MPWEKKTRSYRLVRVDRRNAAGRHALRLVVLFFLLVYVIVNAVPPPEEPEKEKFLIVERKGTKRPDPNEKKRLHHIPRRVREEISPMMPVPAALPVKAVVTVPAEEIVDIMIAYDDIEEVVEEPEFTRPPVPTPARPSDVKVVVRKNPSGVTVDKIKNATTTAQVPEPQSALLILGTVSLLLRRRR